MQLSNTVFLTFYNVLDLRNFSFQLCSSLSCVLQCSKDGAHRWCFLSPSFVTVGTPPYFYD